MDPLNTVFHYAIECFEGMKAFYGVDGKIRMFRPEKNMKRFRTSVKRIALPVRSIFMKELSLIKN